MTDSDIPHSLVMNYVWELPFYKNAEGLKKARSGRLAGERDYDFPFGRPVNICLPNDNAGLGDGDVCERPDIIANPILDRSKRTINEYFNVDAFATPALGTFGNGGRNPVRGAGINNWDLSIFKVTSIPVVRTAFELVRGRIGQDRVPRGDV